VISSEISATSAPKGAQRLTCGQGPPRSGKPAHDGVMSSLDAGQRVHLCRCSPWRNWVDIYLADDAKADAATGPDVWEMPEQYAVGDIVVLVLDARERAIFNIEVMSTDGASDLFETEDTARPYSTGVSVRAVELRMGEPFPSAPATLDDAYAERLLDAVDDEDNYPTPWYITDVSGCTEGLQHFSVDTQREVWQRQLRWECLCCRTDFSVLPFYERNHALQLHAMSAGEPDEEVRTTESVVQLCASCHTIVHGPFAPSVEYLIYGWRPACPICAEHHAISLISGRLDEAPPLGSIATGDEIDSEAADYMCGDCGHKWIEALVTL